jgi:hypothetical protein
LTSGPVRRLIDHHQSRFIPGPARIGALAESARIAAIAVIAGRPAAC